MPAPEFMYNGNHIPIEITWSDASKKLDELGVDILGIIEDSDRVVSTIMLNDRVMLKVWYHYVHEHTNDDFDTAIEYLNSADMTRFKDQFWEAIVSFSNPLARELLRGAWKEAKRQIKLRAKTSENSSSGSSDEQE